MADTYKGESLGKKCARAWHWLVVRRYLGADFLSGKHMFLASREGGDAGVLLALGVAKSNLVAVERDAEAAKSFAARYPDVPLFVGDVANVTRSRHVRGALVSAHLDFCSWYTPNVMKTALAVARFGLRSRSILSVGAMSARETPASYARVEANKSGRLSRSLAAAENCFARQRVLSEELTIECLREGPPVIVRQMSAVAYHSGRTPMSFSLLAVYRGASKEQVRKEALRHFDAHRQCVDSSRALDALVANMDKPLVLWPQTIVVAGRTEIANPLFIGRASPQIALDIADVLTSEIQSVDAAQVLNISPGRLAAWRAHATRGTYARAS